MGRCYWRGPREGDAECQLQVYRQTRIPGISTNYIFGSHVGSLRQGFVCKPRPCASVVDYQDGLGVAMLDILKVIPDGVLVFFPSYKLVEKLVNRWKYTGQWKHLQAEKQLFVGMHASIANCQAAFQIHWCYLVFLLVLIALLTISLTYWGASTLAQNPVAVTMHLRKF